MCMYTHVSYCILILYIGTKGGIRVKHGMNVMLYFYVTLRNTNT